MAVDKNNTNYCGMCRFPALCSHRSKIVRRISKDDVCFKASYKNCALLGYCAVSSDNFLPTFWYDILAPSSPLKMGPIGCPETSIRNYNYSLCNSPEERSSHLTRRGNLESYMTLLFTFKIPFTNKFTFYYTYKMLKFTLKYLIFASTCLGSLGPSSGSLH
jgi:hypothetical protein